MDDFEKEARSYRQSINSLSTEISENAKAVTALESEKETLQSLSCQYQSTVSKRRSERQAHRGEIERADRVKGDITTLKDHAASMKQNILQALSELHIIKHSLEKCSTSVNEQSIDVSYSSTLMERFTEALWGVVPMAQRTRDFNNQRRLLHQALETLDRIHGEVPKLLPRMGGIMFLNMEPWDSSTGPNMGIKTPIPSICYY
ncbi:hypothetical protein MGU_09751 [Metarhizium guizhouense ARSEF 977]|uniref:Uncharacterized protein n=1 Tax=Metarhizium guizhouense (strain ARSEF 977) TaxID=1276136 RepID=A0A0B4G860_METGA|nr:hypothetical protein MGU_09751 [Metarhizium guizhouense ARSEF 977]